MNKYVSRGLWFVLVVGGLTVAGATAANAAETSGDDGVLSGSQAIVGTSVPVTVQNNAISVLGDSASGGSGSSGAAAIGSGATVPAAPAAATATTSGDRSIASGTQAIVAPVIPVTLAGNAVSVLGDSSSSGGNPASTTDAPAQPEPPATTAPTTAPTTTPTTSGDDSLAGGSQLVAAPVVPVTVGGNAVSVLGDSSGSGAGDAPAQPAVTSEAMSVIPATTSGDDSLASGSQLVATPVVPMTVGGNAVSVLGDVGSGAPSEPANATPTNATPPSAMSPNAMSPANLSPAGPRMAKDFALSGAPVAPAIQVASGVATGDAGTGALVVPAGLIGMAPATDREVVTAAVDTDGTGVQAGAQTDRGEAVPAVSLAHTGSDTTGWLALAAVLLIGGLVLIGLTERGGLRN